MDNIKINGLQQFMGKEIPVVYGGFGKEQRCICDKTIAEIHEVEIKHVRELISRNIIRFKENIDFIDLKKVVVLNDNNLLQKLGYTKMQISKAEHIYLLSERGYNKLIKIMDSNMAWVVYNQLMDKYFSMREDKENQKYNIHNGKELIALALIEANKIIEEKENIIATKEQLIGELKPKADYTDRILQSKALVTITQIAKDYGMSGEKINEILHKLKVQYKQNGQWLLYACYQAKGYTHSETIYFKHNSGVKDTKMITKWTQKGRLFLYDILKKNNILPLIEQNQLALSK